MISILRLFIQKNCRLARYILIVLVLPSLQASAAELKWEVWNRFRFYRDFDGKAPAFRTYLKAANATASGPPETWVLRTERKLQKDYHDDNPRERQGWAAENLNNNRLCWSHSKRKFLDDIDDCADYLIPQSHRVRIFIHDSEKLKGSNCQWSISPFGVINQPIYQRRLLEDFANEQKTPTLSCSDALIHVPFDLKGLSGVNVSVRISRANAAPVDLPTIRIVVRDSLILGMGDSFGAGVGNPDDPARISNNNRFSYQGPSLAIGSGAPEGRSSLPVRPGADRKSSVSSRRFRDNAARWLDIRCFRSQYGQQFRAALHSAIADTHHAITFIDLACDGARILEGLMSRKMLGEGFPGGTSVPAQIQEAANLVCGKKSRSRFLRQVVLRDNPSAQICKSNSTICEYQDQKYQNDNAIAKNGIDLKGCNLEDQLGSSIKRPIDQILLSIGGNDIGFAAMVGDSILRRETLDTLLISKILKNTGKFHSGEVGSERLEFLFQKYRHLQQAIARVLPLRDADQSRVLLTSYPIAVADSKGAVCGTNTENAARSDLSMDVDTSFGGLFDDVRKTVHQAARQRLTAVVKTACKLNRWRYSWFQNGLDPDSKTAQEWFANSVCSDAGSAPRPPGGALPWNYISGFVPRSWRHGYCASNPPSISTNYCQGADSDTNLCRESAAEELKMVGYEPNLPTNSSANPYHLKYWRPYASRTRWTRTFNDAFLVTNWHISGRINSRENALTAAITSAMHPTAEGFAVMADSVTRSLIRAQCKNGTKSQFITVELRKVCE